MFKKLFKKKQKWFCYEAWRPNIPNNGCKEQCKECKLKQLEQ